MKDIKYYGDVYSCTLEVGDEITLNCHTALGLEQGAQVIPKPHEYGDYVHEGDGVLVRKSDGYRYYLKEQK